MTSPSRLVRASPGDSLNAWRSRALPSPLSVFPAQYPPPFPVSLPRLSARLWGSFPCPSPLGDAFLLALVLGSCQLSTVRDSRRLPLAGEAGFEEKEIVCCGEALTRDASPPFSSLRSPTIKGGFVCVCTYSQLQAYVRETEAETLRGGVHWDLCCPGAMSFLHHLGMDLHLSRTLSAPPSPASSSIP